MPTDELAYWVDDALRPLVSPRADGYYNVWADDLLRPLVGVGVDLFAPTILSATIDASGTTLTVVFGEEITPGFGLVGFVLSGGYTIGAGTRAGSPSATVTFPVTDGPVVAGETLTLDYFVPPGSVADLVGNPLAAFEDFSVANDSEAEPPDLTAPTVTGAVLAADGQTLSVAYDEPVDPGVAVAGFTVPGRAATFLDQPAPNVHRFTLAPAVGAGVPLTLSYAPGNVVDQAPAANPLAAFSGLAVTNDSAIDLTAPTLVSATINPAGNLLTLVLSENVAPGAGIVGFSLGSATLDVGTRTATPGSVVTIPILGEPVYAGQVVTLSYSQLIGGVVDLAGNALASFLGVGVANNSTIPAPVPALLAPVIRARAQTGPPLIVVVEGE